MSSPLDCTKQPNSSKLIVALDFDDLSACMDLVEQLDPSLCRLKIGKEMFTWFGPRIIDAIQRRNFDIFLDLKFHDIPNTVAKALHATANMGVWMVNVHCAGGRRMLEASAEAVKSGSGPAPILLGVTVLTSMDARDFDELAISESPESRVLRLAKLAADCGLDGVVSSAREVGVIKTECGSRFVCVSPGIRPADSANTDQRRVVTPAQALAEGSDYIVVGRPITRAPDPMAALQSILREMRSV